MRASKVSDDTGTSTFMWTFLSSHYIQLVEVFQLVQICLFQLCHIKGVPRMVNKLKARDDHRVMPDFLLDQEMVYRAGQNIDINRNAVTFQTVPEMIAFVGLLEDVFDGVARTKNMFAFPFERAEMQLHYRTLMMVLSSPFCFSLLSIFYIVIVSFVFSLLYFALFLAFSLLECIFSRTWSGHHKKVTLLARLGNLPRKHGPCGIDTRTTSSQTPRFPRSTTKTASRSLEPTSRPWLPRTPRCISLSRAKSFCKRTWREGSRCTFCTF